MNYPVCPCDGAAIATPVNLPELSHIGFRIGTYADFRRAVLTPLFQPALPDPIPLEETLSVAGVPVWRTDGVGDLGVMVAEWFAYVADVLTFYNEQIANQDFLRTADLPESVNNLIAILGYRPRPAIGAKGYVAALRSTGPNFGNRPIVLPKALSFQSKPAPGQQPQTFELSADTAITAPDQIAKVRRATDLPFLIPGVGVQGGDLESSARAAFNGDPASCLISSSRTVLYAGNPSRAASALRAEINAVVGARA